jgi:biotin carboxyl carrier protein
MNDTKYDYIEIDGVKYHTTLPKKFTDRKPISPPEPGNVATYIPGTIVEVHVREGQRVKAGQLLCILEAMKMRNKILAPADGTVTEVHVKQGDKLPKNTLMFKIQ